MAPAYHQLDTYNRVRHGGPVRDRRRRWPRIMTTHLPSPLPYGNRRLSVCEPSGEETPAVPLTCPSLPLAPFKDPAMTAVFPVAPVHPFLPPPPPFPLALPSPSTAPSVHGQMQPRRAAARTDAACSPLALCLPLPLPRARHIWPPILGCSPGPACPPSYQRRGTSPRPMR